MTHIALVGDQLMLGEQAIHLPVPISQLQALLGPSRHQPKVARSGNHLHVWDELGIVAYAKDGEFAQSLSLLLGPGDAFPHQPSASFAGTLTIDGEDALSFRHTHAASLRRLFDGDTGKALIRGAVSIWFNVKDHQDGQGEVVDDIDISAYSAPQPKPQPAPAPLDADFEHLRTPVAQWLAQVQAIVPSDNAFYTLIPGVDAHTIRHYAKLDEDTQVPPELLNFYKLVNVKLNAVTSACFFEVAGTHFDLLPFKRIGEAWQDLENLCAGELDEELAQGYDARVQADDYVSAGWIPFAHDHEGNYLLYDTEPSDSGRHGQIIALNNAGWTREVLADSLTDLIEAATRTLQSGNTRAFEFVLREG